ncbi:MAG: MBG domain-containing protein [Pseudomonadota bacterium]
MSKQSTEKRYDVSRQATTTHHVHLKPVCAALLFAFSVQGAQANPLGGAVVNGQADIVSSGNTLTVTNTPGTIINWQDFSIGSNEITRFAQQSASSTVLNRVIGGNPSNILGSLQSNGQVFLLNPSGIIFGAGATVDVAGLVAGTLNLSNADFLAGRHHYTAVPGAQNLSNAGNLAAQSGGQIYLIAPNVENSGIITALNGEILLAAGHEVELVNGNDPALRVNLTAPAGDATNVGQLIAEAGSLGLFGTVVRNSGTVSADSATMRGGKIVFRASQRVEAGGTMSASGTGTPSPQPQPLSWGERDSGGGTILLLADMQSGTVNVSGTLDASALAQPTPALPSQGGSVKPPLTSGGLEGFDGGFIETSAAHVNVADSARITTAAANGRAGTWLIDPTDYTIAAVDPLNGSSFMSGAALGAAVAAGNVIIQTAAGGVGNGDILISDAVLKSALATTATTLTLQAHNDVVFASAASVVSQGGALNVVVNSDLDGIGGGAIVMNPGSSIVSNGGNITLGGGTAGDGSGRAIGNATYANGIFLGDPINTVGLGGGTLNASGTFNGGNISLRGQGAAGTIRADGVYVTDGSLITTSHAGTITLDGVGGNGTNDNNGVRLGTNATISAVDGAITLMGQGGLATGSFNHGVYIHNSSQVSATGTGVINITGRGGSVGTLGASNRGVRISTATVSSNSGAITINGTGAYDGDGVQVVSGANVTSTTGLIDVIGTSGEAVSFAIGTYLSGGHISSEGGVKISGTSIATGTGGSNRGVRISSASSVSTGFASGSSIIINAQGGNRGDGFQLLSGSTLTAYYGRIEVNAQSGTNDALSTGSVYGLWVSGVGTSMAAGNGITLSGQSLATVGDNNRGIAIDSGATLDNFAFGSEIVLNGAGGGGGSFNEGVLLSGAGTTISGGGTLSINGRGGAGTGTFNRGVHIQDGAQVFASGTGDIKIGGLGAATATSSFGRGIEVGSGARVSSSSGNIELTGDCWGSTCGTLGTTDNIGIYLTNSTVLNALQGGEVASISGDITMKGNSWGNGVRNHGVVFDSGNPLNLDSGPGTGGKLEIVGRGANGGYGFSVTSSSVPGLVGGTNSNGEIRVTSIGDMNVAGVNAVDLLGSGATFKFRSTGNIFINAPLAVNNSGDVILRADMEGSGVGTITFGPNGSVSHIGGGTSYLYYNPVSYTDALTKSDALGNPYTAFMGASPYRAFMLVNDVFDLQAMNGNASGNFALGRDIVANVVLNPVAVFSGWFDGQHQTITGLNSSLFRTIGTNAMVGRFRLINSSIRNCGFECGALATVNNGTVDGVYAINPIVIGAISAAGGLLGTNTGSISNSYVSGGSISANQKVGGLVGVNSGSIDSSYVSGNLAAVQNGGGNTRTVGGLVGLNSGGISNSYVSGGTVTSAITDGTGNVGGLVGVNSSLGTVSNSYASNGIVCGGAWNCGGVIGQNFGGVTNTFWDSDTAGAAVLFGLGHDGRLVTGGATNGSPGNTGALPLTTANFMINANFTAATPANGNISPTWDFLNTWWQPVSDGNLRPMLQSEWSQNISNAHQLQLMAMNLNADYRLVADIDMAELANPGGVWDVNAGFMPIWGGMQVQPPFNFPISVPFTGTLDGAGHVINNLRINRPTESAVGLFGILGRGASVTNVGLSNVDITGGNYVGALAGRNGNGSGSAFGSGAAASITNSYVSGGTVSGGSAVTGGSGVVGGLVGSNSGFIANSYAGSGTVSVTGAVGFSSVGGLIGRHSGVLENAYSTNAVIGGVSSDAGGLIGSAGCECIPVVNNTYASGLVTGGVAGQTGGLIGTNFATVSNSYWDVTTTGQAFADGSGNSVVSGITGLTTAAAMTRASYANFDFASTWWMPRVDGNTRPFLQMEHNARITNAHQLQLMAMDLNANYTLGADIDMAGTTQAGQMWSGKGFVPVGRIRPFPNFADLRFTGQLDGNGHTIRNLAINRPASDYIGLFGRTNGATIRNLILSNPTVSGGGNVGTLIGEAIGGTISLITANNVFVSGALHSSGIGGLVGGAGSVLSDNLAVTGSVTAPTTGFGNDTGGLFGSLSGGDVVGATFSGTVSGRGRVGGVAGSASGTITRAAFSGTITGRDFGIGGLVGGGGFGMSLVDSQVSGATLTSTVTATAIGGLIGDVGFGTTISNSHFNVDSVTTNGVNRFGLGGLYDVQFNDWANNGLMLNIANYNGAGQSLALNALSGRHTISTLQGVKDLIGFADVPNISYALAGSFDLTALPGYYVPRFAGDFDGGNFTFSNLNLSGQTHLGMFGEILSGATVSNLSVLNASINGWNDVGGLAGINRGTINNSFVDGATLTASTAVGGLVGSNFGSVSNSYVNNGMVAATTNDGNADAGGLVGYNAGSISNSYVSNGSVVNASTSLQWRIGGLVGFNDVGGTIDGSYVSGGTVDGNGTGGSGSSIGGLVGLNSGTVNNSYVSGGTVIGDWSVGGLVGSNSGSISNSYVSGGSVTGTGFNVGGLVGVNGGAVRQTYASTAVMGSGAGGLIGNDFGTALLDNYWDVAVSGQTFATGSGLIVPGITGLTAAQMMSMASFTGFDIANTGGAGTIWRIYEGQTMPLLASFLTPLTVTADNVVKLYDGATSVLANALYSVPNADTSGHLFNLADPYNGAVNAGVYTPGVGGLYSDQQGFDISYLNGTLTINPKPLTASLVTAISKIYDGTPSATLTTADYSLGGFVAGQGATVTQTLGSYNSQNVLTASTVTAALSPGDFVAGANTLLSNYVLPTTASGGGSITPAPLTVTANALGKVYGDADPFLSYNAPGLLGGDTLSGAQTRVAGENVGSYAISRGSLDNANYAINYTGSNLGITPATLTVKANNIGKVEGDVDPLLSYLTFGLKFSDTAAGTLSGALQRIAGETVGNYAINQGTLGLLSTNYTLTYVPGTFGIVPVPSTTDTGFVDGITNTTLIAGGGASGSGQSTITMTPAEILQERKRNAGNQDDAPPPVCQ